MTSPTKIDAYKFHGLALKPVKGEDQFKGDCPFCGKEDHFFVNGSTGQFQCKVCGESGNVYSFLQKIHADALKRTKKADWERLSSMRGNLPWSIFRDHKLAYHKETKRWLLPINNFKGSLANLMVYGPPKVQQLMGTPGCDQHLFGMERINPSGPIYACEGQWDAMALQWLMERNRIDGSQFSVVAVPGANTFKKDWLGVFKNREVFLCFDHDSAGSAGMDKAAVHLKDAQKVRRIQWPSTSPEGYDVRDFVSARQDKYKETLKAFYTLFPEKEISKKPKLIRNNFASVVKDFRKLLHTNKRWEEALAICCAVVVSGKLKNDPLWLFMVGPPGAGKTLLVESFYNRPEDTVYLSKLTRPALVSGFRGEEDYGVLGSLDGKCLIIKDYTAVVSMPIGVQEELYGILRDAYDGTCIVPFGNMEPRKYENLYFSMIASVTDVIRGHNRAALGERFLKVELLDEDHDHDPHIRSAISAVGDDIEKKARQEEFLRDSVAAFMSRPFNETTLPKVPTWLEDRVVHLVQLCSYLRAVVAKDAGELAYRPRPEIGTRFAKQIVKLARCLCWVFDKRKIDEQIYSIVQRVALETVLGWDLEILHGLFAAKKGLVVSDLGSLMQLSHTGITRRLEHLQHLGIVYRTDDFRKDAVGRKRHIWFMSENIRTHWANAKLQYAPPPKVRFKTRSGYKPKTNRKPSKPLSIHSQKGRANAGK